MAWQELFSLPDARLDVEQERERRLAAQASAGASWAFDALVARYQPPVTRYLTRLIGDARRARALSESVFVRMDGRLRGPHGGEHLRLWLLRASTEAGLDALRHPKGEQARLRQMSSPEPALGLPPEEHEASAAQRLRQRLNTIVDLTSVTSKQVRGLIWSAAPTQTLRRSVGSLAARAPLGGRPFPPLPGETDDADGPASAGAAPEERAGVFFDDDEEPLDAREALRHQVARLILVELPYGDAQCLALHLIAGLNQAEVALALGLRPSAARHRIVHGLRLFAEHYEAAERSLGVSLETRGAYAAAQDGDEADETKEREAITVSRDAPTFAEAGAPNYTIADEPTIRMRLTAPPAPQTASTPPAWQPVRYGPPLPTFDQPDEPAGATALDEPLTRYWDQPDEPTAHDANAADVIASLPTTRLTYIPPDAQIGPVVESLPTSEAASDVSAAPSLWDAPVEPAPLATDEAADTVFEVFSGGARVTGAPIVVEAAHDARERQVVWPPDAGDDAPGDDAPDHHPASLEASSEGDAASASNTVPVLTQPVLAQTESVEPAGRVGWGEPAPGRVVPVLSSTNASAGGERAPRDAYDDEDDTPTVKRRVVRPSNAAPAE